MGEVRSGASRMTGLLQNVPAPLTAPLLSYLLLALINRSWILKIAISAFQ